MASDEQIQAAVEEVDRILEERIPVVTREAVEEIARLKGELSRAAVREGYLRAASEPGLCTDCGGGHMPYCPRCVLATPSPLSDAAHKVLETTAWAIAQWRSGESEPRFILGQLGLVSNAFRALLEGREEG